MPSTVSVIIPCFNNAPYLQEAVQSVLSQTFSDLECIIVDDGSTDNTREISEYLVKKDSRVKYLFQENRGMAAARNTGIKHAEGEWIQFLDSDDWIHENKLKFQLDYLRNHGPKNYNEIVLYTAYELVYVDESSEVVKTDTRIHGSLTNDQLLEWAITWDLEGNFPLIVHSMLFKSSIFENIMFNEKFLSYADIELETNLLLRGVPFFYTPIVGAFYRKHQTNTTRNWRRIRHYYTLYLEGLRKKNKDLLQGCPNMGKLIKQAFKEKDKNNFKRLMRLVDTTRVPVYLTKKKINFNYPRLLRSAYFIDTLLIRSRLKGLYRRLRKYISVILHEIKCIAMPQTK